MIPADASPLPLVYDRIAHNRRKTWLLAALSVLALLPFVLSMSYAIARGVMWRFVPHTPTTSASFLRREEAYLAQPSLRVSDSYRLYLTRRLEQHREAAARQQADGNALLYSLMPVAAAGLMAMLGIVFWAIASAPTAKLLVQAGAQPVTDRDQEAVRLLENLAIGAGLPTPSLYVIESAIPNAFAAGRDPQHSVIAVTRGALTLFDRRELEGVLAHELSHIGNHDIRLNTFAAAIALFLRIPYLLFRSELESPTRWGVRGGFRVWSFILSPIGLYILFVAPVLGVIIRAAISRGREYLADADAALLTRYPEGLLRALTKIAGAGSVVQGANPAFSHFYFANPLDPARGWFTGNLLATHPPLSSRLQKLMELHGPASEASLREALEAGRRYSTERPAIAVADDALALTSSGELGMFSQGNPLGRVFRVRASAPARVYDTPSPHSPVLANVAPGDLIVAFDDPGPMRQVCTANETFGYIPRSVKLVAVPDLIPAEVYDPKLRAAAEARLPALPASAPAAPALTSRQIAITVGFGVVVFAGFLVILIKLT